MDKKLVFVTRHYKKGWLSIDYFLFDIHRFILININRNGSMSSELKSPEQCRIHQIELNKKSIEQIQI